jgi:hypothetical protein
MGGCQRAVGIELDEHITDLPVHQIPGDPADPNCSGAMRTGWPTHNRTNHIIENTGRVILHLFTPHESDIYEMDGELDIILHRLNLGRQ